MAVPPPFGVLHVFVPQARLVDDDELDARGPGHLVEFPVAALPGVVLVVVHQPDHVAVVPGLEGNIAMLVRQARHVHAHSEFPLFRGNVARGRGVAVVGAGVDGVPGDKLARRVLGHAHVFFQVVGFRQAFCPAGR